MAGEDITVAQLRQLLGVQDELRQQAENRWRNAQRVLVSLLETFAPEEVDRRLMSGLALDSLGVEELAQLVNTQLGTRFRQATSVHNKDGCLQAMQELKDQFQASQEELKRLRIENQRLIAETQELKDERNRLQSQLSALQQALPGQMANPTPDSNRQPVPGPPPEKGAPEPDWMAAWRKTETFERDSSVLRLLGETGLSRRPHIEQQAAERLGIRRAGGSFQALFKRLETLGLIEVFRPWDNSGSKTGGRAPDLVRLAERGRLAYWLLANAEPVPNEYDALLARHVSPEHTLLNLQAADALREAGYQINAFPSDIHLPDGGLFKPDLLAVDQNGQIFYIEVETEANKNREQRQAKWRNALQAGGSQLYVFCDNRACMRSIRSEINFSLGRQAGQYFLTNLVDLQAGKRASDGGIWLDARRNQANY